MGHNVDELLALMNEGDPFIYSQSDIFPLQLKAATERLDERRATVRMLDVRARETQIHAIHHLSDLVPTLFSHRTYKSYPDSFISNMRWGQMCRWLQTLSALPLDTEAVYLSGVQDVDDWVYRLRDVNHLVFSSSGTTGKSSFLDQAVEDLELSLQLKRLHLRWAAGVDPSADRPVFLLGPRGGTSGWADAFDGWVTLFGRPGAVYYLLDRPYSAAETNRLGELQRAMLAGQATPGDIAAHERFVKEREAETSACLSKFVDILAAHVHEPILIVGTWSPFWLVMLELRARGVTEGAFHPDTLIRLGGGRKTAQWLPPDYEEQISRFLGLDPAHQLRAYGMVEMPYGFPGCSAGRYHRPPWVVWLVLNRTGDRLVERNNGSVNGRMALLDLSISGRWGGLITGDNVSIDYSRCPCGRPGPTVASVTRYQDLPDGDDKLTCDGAIEAYLRGMIQ